MPKKKAHPASHSEHQHQSKLLRPAKLHPAVLISVMALVALTGVLIVYRSFAAGDSMTLLPASSSPSLGSSFTVTIHENSGTDAINAVESDLTYDTTKLQYVSADTTTNTNFNSPNGSCIAPTGGSGSVKIACAKFGTGLTGDQAVATVTFTAIGTGATAVNFANTSQVIRASDTVNVLAVTTGGTYTIADTTAPSTPGGLTAGTKTVTSNAFTWTAATDNVAVTGYKVFRNGTLVNGNVATTSFTDTGLNPNTSYSYTVQAFDAAGNTSPASAALAMSTLADTSAPTVPAGLTAGTKTISTIAMTWTASTDNVAVAGYNIFRNGTKVGTSATASYTDTGLASNTSYSYTVSAFDAVPNTSAVSTALAISTLADTTPPTVPTGLVSSAQTVNSISLSWAASTDNSGVVSGYKIFRNGTQVGTSGTTSFTDTGLVQNTAYAYSVAAYDPTGNTSAQTASSSFSTTSKPGDINSDGVVDIVDLSILAAHYRQAGTFSQGDLNGDGVVDVIDFSILALHWGT